MVRLAALGLAAVGLGCEVAPSIAAGSGSSDDGRVDAATVATDATTTTGGESTTGAEPAPDACASACVDLDHDPGRELCYACRCKHAFDDWLPSPEQLQCDRAEPIVTYEADLSTPEGAWVPAGIGVTHCANPSIFTGSCAQHSRLGQLEHGDVMVRWICRDPYLDLDGRLLYHDVAVIGQNVRTGVACFWDDVDDVTHGDDLPPLDLEQATAAQRAEFGAKFYVTEGENCTPCHDHDPFIYTPYLASTDWRSVAMDRGPYGLVGLDGHVRATGARHLVSPRASPCTSCHRLGDGKTCTTLAADALGAAKEAQYEAAVLDAMLPGSPRWWMAYWMPGAGAPITDEQEWHARFDDARAHVLACCETPGENVGDCEWADVPAR